MGKICAFFGHRDAPYYLAENKYIERAIISLIENEDVDTFWFGGNGDFDSYANSAAQRVQEQLYPLIKRVLIAAYQQQIYPFAEEEARQVKLMNIDSSYEPLKGIPTHTNKYDSVIYPDKLLASPKRFAISYRNKYEVENADFFICYITKEYGGAYNAYKLTKRRNKKVINLADDEEVKRLKIEHKKMEEYRKLYGDKPEYIKIFND